MWKLFISEILYAKYHYLIGIILLLNATADFLAPLDFNTNTFTVGVTSAVLFTLFVGRTKETADRKLMNLPLRNFNIAWIRTAVLALPWFALIGAVLLYERIALGTPVSELIKFAVQLGEISQIFFIYIISRDLFFVLPFHKKWTRYGVSVLAGLAVLSLPVIVILLLGKFKPVPGLLIIYACTLFDVFLIPLIFSKRREFLK